MVRQAGKRLDADNVRRPGGQKLHHLPSEEPTLAGLVADGQERLCHLRHLPDGHGRLKAAAPLQGADRRGTHRTDEIHPNVRRGRGCPALTEKLVQVVVGIHAVVHEVHEVRHHDLRTLALQQVHQVVVGKGHVLDQDLAHNAHARFQ